MVGLVPEEFSASEVMYPVLPVANRLTYEVHVTVIPVLEPNLSFRVVAAGTVRLPCYPIQSLMSSITGNRYSKMILLYVYNIAKQNDKY